MPLESWELIIFNLALGSLISGFLLFFFSIFTAGFHFGGGGHGGHVGHVGHVGHTGHLGHIGHMLHIPHLPHLGHIGHLHVSHTGQHGHVHHAGKLDQNPETPILLIISAFMLMFGAIGTVIYQLQVFDPIFRILSVILVPLIFVKLVSMIWSKLVSNEHGYDIPTVSIDNQVKTLTAVDENGGLVLADTGDLRIPDSINEDEKIKMFARTLPGVSIERGNIAYVIDIDQKNALIIDFWPKIAKKQSESNEN